MCNVTLCYTPGFLALCRNIWLQGLLCYCLSDTIAITRQSFFFNQMIRNSEHVLATAAPSGFMTFAFSQSPDFCHCIYLLLSNDEPYWSSVLSYCSCLASCRLWLYRDCFIYTVLLTLHLTCLWSSHSTKKLQKKKREQGKLPTCFVCFLHGQTWIVAFYVLQFCFLKLILPVNCE